MPTLHRTDTLADRLRALADEIESAERYGVPIPTVVSVNSFPNIEPVAFSATADEFDAWADYTDAETGEYRRDGKRVRSASVDVNGLRVTFAHTSAGRE